MSDKDTKQETAILSEKPEEVSGNPGKTLSLRTGDNIEQETALLNEWCEYLREKHRRLYIGCPVL
jgi:hypothetical protein